MPNSTRKIGWFSYEKPSLFMTQETPRSRRNLIAMSSISLLYYYRFLSINNDASFYGITVNFVPSSAIKIEHVFSCVIFYEIAMFCTRIWADYGAWADVRTVKAGGFGDAGSVSSRQLVKGVISQAKDLLSKFQEQISGSNAQQEEVRSRDTQRLIDELQKYNAHSFWRALFENSFFSIFDLFIPLALGIYALVMLFSR